MKAGESLCYIVFYLGSHIRVLQFHALCVYFDTDYVLSAFAAVCQAFLFDPPVLDVPVPPTSSLSYTAYA